MTYTVGFNIKHRLIIWPYKFFNPVETLAWSRTLQKQSRTYLSGIRKCRRDHNSFSEFCSGVPVMSSLWLDLKSISVLYSSESSFFNLCASSTPRNAQFMFPKTLCRNKNKNWHFFSASTLKLQLHNKYKVCTSLVQKKIILVTLSFSKISYVVRSVLNFILLVCWWIHS